MEPRSRTVFYAQCPTCRVFLGPFESADNARQSILTHADREHKEKLVQPIVRKVYFIDTHQVRLTPIETQGLILDIGGGGEGTIGLLNGKKVVAIDPSLKELEETENESLKIVMDARDLKFLPESFDVATSFFTMLFIDNSDHPKVFQEIHRILKPEGRFLILDTDIPDDLTHDMGFGIKLEISLPDRKVNTSYVRGKADDKGQSLLYFEQLGAKTGFKNLKSCAEGSVFFIELIKLADSQNRPAA